MWAVGATTMSEETQCLMERAEAAREAGLENVRTIRAATKVLQATIAETRRLLGANREQSRQAALDSHDAGTG